MSASNGMDTAASAASKPQAPFALGLSARSLAGLLENNLRVWATNDFRGTPRAARLMALLPVVAEIRPMFQTIDATAPESSGRRFEVEWLARLLRNAEALTVREAPEDERWCAEMKQLLLEGWKAAFAYLAEKAES